MSKLKLVRHKSQVTPGDTVISVIHLQEPLQIAMVRLHQEAVTEKVVLFHSIPKLLLYYKKIF